MHVYVGKGYSMALQLDIYYLMSYTLHFWTMKLTKVSQLYLLYWVWFGDYNGLELGTSLCLYQLVCVNVQVSLWRQALMRTENSGLRRNDFCAPATHREFLSVGLQCLMPWKLFSASLIFLQCWFYSGSALISCDSLYLSLWLFCFGEYFPMSLGILQKICLLPPSP